MLFFHIEKTWSYFVDTFTKLWIGEGVEAYTKEKQWLPIILQNIFTDVVGFAGCELIRRTIGLAHVADLDEIANKEKRIQAKKQALYLGKELIKYESKTLIFNCSEHYFNRQFLEGKSMSTIVTIPRSVSWKGMLLQY